jgi:formylmethanofuran dehydrogenase subunit E
VSKRPFRITKQEIDFYVKHNIPLPTKHPDIRHKERFDKKDPIIMHLIHCSECGEEMLSVHLPYKGKRILCEKCYYKNK